MHSRSVRFVVGAFVGMFLLFVAGQASAQSQTPLADSMTAAVLHVASPAVSPVVAAPLRARFAAQDQNGSDENQGIGIGVLGMLNWNTLDADEFEFESKTGGGVGFWVGGNRNGRVGFVGEFIYGWRNADQAGDELRTTVFQIPAVFHINFGSRSRNALGGYVVLGPSFTFNLKQEVNGVELEDDDAFKGADIGFIAGGGIEIFRVGVELRGNWGLRSITPEGDVEDVGDLKNRSIELVGKFAFN